MTLFNALILSRLDYCSRLWSPHLIRHIIQIEKVQRSFTKCITGVTFIEVTFMLGCPHSCIIGHHIILPLVQPIGVSYPFVYTILIKTGHISSMKDGVIMCNNRNISLN